MKEQMKGGGDKMNINLPYIKMMREKKGRSMQYMAELLGFKSAPAYFHYEKGERKFRADMLPVLARAFDCKIEDLYC